MIETTKSFRTSDGVLWSTMRAATAHETACQLTVLLEKNLPSLDTNEGDLYILIAGALISHAETLHELLTRYLQECRPVVAAEQPPPGWERIGQSS